MKARFLLLAWFLTVWVGSTPAWSQVPAAKEPASPAPVMGPHTAPATALAHRVEHLKAALSRGDEAELGRAAREVEILQRTYGTLDMSPLVDGLLLWARAEGKAGRTEVGLKAVDLAERWTPGSADVLSTRITLLRSSGPKGYFQGMPDLLKLNQLRLNHAGHRWLWLVHHLAWLRMMATLMLWGWALTLALRYRRVLRHVWEEPLLKQGLNGQVISLVGALILTAPVLVGLDPSVSAIIALYLLAPYMLTDEVKITVLVIGLQIVHPALALMEPMAAAEPSPSIVALQMQPQVRPLPPALLERLPEEDRTFLHGWEQLQRQDWAGAAETFTTIKATHPNRAEVLNNIGVAEFQMGRKEEALRTFDAACQADPNSPEILINQSLLAFEKIDTPVGTAKLEQARKAAPDHFEQLMGVNKVSKEPRSFPLPLPDSPSRVRALVEVYLDRTPIPWSQRVPFLALAMGLVIPLGGVGLFIRHLRMSIGMAHPTQCIRCGEAFHTTDSPDPNVCPKCHHLFVLRDGLHQESRKKKLDEVALFQKGQRRIHKALMALLPGCDAAFMGDARDGFMEFGSLCFAAGLVWATGRTVRYPGEIIPDPSSTWMPLGAALLLILFIRSWMRIPHRRG